MTDEQVKYMVIRMDSMEKDIENIRDNHLPHIRDTLNKQAQDIQEVQTNLEWIKKLIWAVLLTAIGGLGTGLFNIILQ